MPCSIPWPMPKEHSSDLGLAHHLSRKLESQAREFVVENQNIAKIINRLGI